MHQDGSGHLVVTTAVRNAYLEYLAGVTGTEDPTVAFNETQLKAAAAKYGKQIEYVAHTVKKGEERAILQVTYRFKDLSDVSVRLDPSLPLLEGIHKDHQPPQIYPAYSFHHRGQGQFTIYAPKDTGGSSSQLHVRVESDTAKRQQQERLKQERTQWMKFDNPFGLNGNETREELITTLGNGMRFRFEIETLSPIKSTTSHYKLGNNRILMYSIELEKLLQDPNIKPLFLGSGAKGPMWSDLIRSEASLVETSRYRLLELESPEESPRKQAE